jgi:hypothetical protein
MSWYKFRWQKVIFAESGISAGRPAHRWRPLLVEPLETRWVPTTLTPTTFFDGGLGSGSLRDAVLQFNADTGTGDDIIQLLAGTYTLTIPNAGGHHETAGLTGDLNLTQTSHRWIIQGTGPSTIIDASQLQDRVFQIVNPGTQVVFQNLVIQGGLAQEDGTDGALRGTTDALGGGLLNNGGDVTLDNVILQNNTAQGANGANGEPPHAGLNAQGGGVYSAGGTLTISHSTLAHNRASGGNGGNVTTGANSGATGGVSQGGGLYLGSGTLTVADSTVTANTLVGGTGGHGGCAFGGEECGGGGDGGATRGGGLYVAGSNLTLTDSTITAQTLTAGNGGPQICSFNGCHPAGHGGASQGSGVYVSGMVSTTDVTISANTLHGGNGSRGEASAGGGLYVNGTVTASSSIIATNTLSAGDSGSDAQGGGLYVNGTAIVNGSAITANTLSTGYGGGNAQGGGLFVNGTANMNRSMNTGNILSAGNGGGNAQGGGLYAAGGTLTISDSTLANNRATGGIGEPGYLFFTHYGSFDYCVGGGAGGRAQGGGLYSTSGALTISGSTLANNRATGGIGGTAHITNSCAPPAGPGGNAQGGGLYAAGGLLTFEDSTVAGNTVSGGAGGHAFNSQSGSSGGPGQAGGLWVATGATTQLSFSTIAANQATGGTHGNGTPAGTDGPATAGGLDNQGLLQTRDIILADNTVTGPGTNSSPDLAGNLGSLGHNLIGNPQGSSGFDPSDLLNVDPRLGPLQDNGGLTQTMALLPGSPAIDAGDNTAAPMWDQRGAPFHRIVNGVIDIGAFEVQAHAHGRPTGQPVPDPVPVQGLPGSPLLGQPPDVSATPVPLPDPAPVTADGRSSAAGAFLPADAVPGWAVGPLDLFDLGDLDPLARALPAVP